MAQRNCVRIHFDCIDSTNTYAKTHSREFDPDQITCITADEQTAGRGRFQRSWISPPKVNLYTTFYFRLPPKTPHLISLAQVLAFSLASILIQNGLQPRIKWPNDIQLNGKKLSGVLCETFFSEHFVEIFLGIGINVNMEASALADVGQPATSLKIETGKTWDKQKLLHQLEKQFLADLEQFEKSGFFPFHTPFENLLAYRGQTIRCFDGKKEWVGICYSLTSDGQLNLRLPDGSMHTVISGEIG
jgi:BirA family biotin operon repressor/biotin-[acetyl-CoA-carboxylase] ligase